ncbi:MAG: BspA family leucine-rich repeat surface protein, partial [Bacteroidetes bacterium]|nr:BspA family leucine-rich repeat surface protein [Bacteroidota bacterium]
MLDGSGNPTGTPDSIINAGDNQQISGLTAGKEYRLYAFGGNFNRINFSYNSNSRNDILRVKQWGTAQWSSFEYAFYYCPNLDVVATDAPDLSAVTNMTYMFQNCTGLTFNNSINSWDARNVTDMNGMFYNASAFNQSIGGMKLKASVNMTQILYNTAIDCSNLSATIAGWKAQAQNDSNLKSVYLNSFIGNNLYYDQNARQDIYYLQSAPRSWTISPTNRTLINCSDTASAWFITEWKASNNYIYFPASSGSYTIKYIEIDNAGTEIGNWHTISNASANHYINQHIQAGKRYRIKAFGGSFRQIYFY